VLKFKDPTSELQALLDAVTYGRGPDLYCPFNELQVAVAVVVGLGR
jgi:hypothetical protein